MAMVAKDVPVAKAMDAEVRNTSTGMISSGSASLRTCATYWAVPKSVVTFPRDHASVRITIAKNIAFGLEQSIGSPDLALIEGPAVAAGLAKDLAVLPNGYETVVGERGITLSGGQRQRVALARAIACDPKVMILDDSLSSVDAETEKSILAELSAVLKNRTAIIITHRVAAVRKADQIAVLDGGKLAELGTHAELLSKGGIYAELYQTQLEKEQLL